MGVNSEDADNVGIDGVRSDLFLTFEAKMQLELSDTLRLHPRQHGHRLYVDVDTLMLQNVFGIGLYG